MRRRAGPVYPRLGTLLLLTALLAPPANAGAWLRLPRELYVKAGWSQFASDEVFAAKGNRKVPGPDFRDHTVSLYGEYGLNANWTAIGSVAYKSLASELAGVDRDESGFADVWLFTKRALLRAPVVLSTQVGAKFPLGYDERSVPPLGQGQIDVEARLLAGRGFRVLRRAGYGGAEIGYRRRNGDYSDEIPYRLEAGVFSTPAILWRVALDGIENRSNDAASRVGSARLGENVFDQEYMKAGPSVIFFSRAGMQVELGYEAVVSGGNTAAGDIISFSLAWLGPLR